MIVMDVRSAELTKYAANAMLATKISFMNEIGEPGRTRRRRHREGSHRHRLGSAHRLQLHLSGRGLRRLVLPEGRAGADALGRRGRVRRQYSERRGRSQRRQKQVLFNKIKAHFGDLQGRTIAVWGLAFKPNTDDMREAPSRVLMEALWAAGAKVRAYDPVAMPEASRIYGERSDLILCKTGPAALDGADALAIVTEWQEFRSPDFRHMKDTLKTPAIFDGRNLYDPAQMARAGFSYYAIGRGKRT